MVVQLMTMVEKEESAARAAQVMVVQEVKAETGNSLWVLTRFQMVVQVVQAVLAVQAVRVALPMVTAAMAGLVEKAALLMVEAVDMDMMRVRPQIMVIL
jgi:hypothetical protein